MWTRKLVEDRLAEAVKLLARYGGRSGGEAFAEVMRFGADGLSSPHPILSINVSLPDSLRLSLRSKCGPHAEQLVVESLGWSRHVVDGRHWGALITYALGSKVRRAANEIGVDRKTFLNWRHRAANEIVAALNAA